MSAQLQLFRSSQQVLVLLPTEKNYFHEMRGRRLAESLRSLGLAVDAGNLDDPIEKNYDWCILANVSEFHLSRGSAGIVADAIRRLRPNCRAFVCCLSDCTDITSIEAIQRRCRALGIDFILDVGFSDRIALLPTSMRSLYHHVFNGLTPSEQEAVRHDKNEEERPIPWVFIGHATAHRVALVNQLITVVDPRGFVYMPNLGTAATKDLQQLNQRQYETVLRKCGYHIWYANRQPLHLETERFHLSLLTGCVPIQVISEDEKRPAHLPFDYLIYRESEAANKIRQFNFYEIRRRFRADFLAFPSLAEGLAKFLASRSLLPSTHPSIGRSQAA